MLLSRRADAFPPYFGRLVGMFVRRSTSIFQPCRAQFPVPLDPLVQRLSADLVATRNLTDALPRFVRLHPILPLPFHAVHPFQVAALLVYDFARVLPMS